MLNRFQASFSGTRLPHMNYTWDPPFDSESDWGPHWTPGQSTDLPNSNLVDASGGAYLQKTLDTNGISREPFSNQWMTNFPPSPGDGSQNIPRLDLVRMAGTETPSASANIDPSSALEHGAPLATLFQLEEIMSTIHNNDTFAATFPRVENCQELEWDYLCGDFLVPLPRADNDSGTPVEASQLFTEVWEQYMEPASTRLSLGQPRSSTNAPQHRDPDYDFLYGLLGSKYNSPPSIEINNVGVDNTFSTRDHPGRSADVSQSLLPFFDHTQGLTSVPQHGAYNIGMDNTFPTRDHAGTIDISRSRWTRTNLLVVLHNRYPVPLTPFINYAMLSSWPYWIPYTIFLEQTAFFPVDIQGLWHILVFRYIAIEMERGYVRAGVRCL
jgi:hypothetical protein